MKAYLLISGTLFGLLAVEHMIRVVDKWRELTTDPWFVLAQMFILVISVVLSAWAWRLHRTVVS
jgi:hypothetical protein